MQTLRLFVPPLAQIWLLLCIGLGSTWAASGERLPVGVVPLAYTLDLTIVPDQPNFKGKTEIDVTLAAVTSRIQMHGRGLVASEAFVQLPDGRRIAATFAEDGDTGYASLTTVEAVGPGPAKIVISYSGAISKSLNGLYSVKHKNLTYAYTQMESIYARQVFPSFDEPKFKTPFTFSITHPADQIAISNGPETAKTDAGDGMTRTNFATTQPLPTYLTAIAVGEFDVVTWEALPPNEVRKRAIPLRGIAPKGDGSKLNYALLNTRSLFEVQEKWFGIAYPYAKLDLVAVHRMQAGGMENAGAIFYRANLLLLPPEASVYAQRSYAFVHAHELAHSWFGNYVTPNWWDDIWLNESFATWFGNKSLNLWQPTNYSEYEAVETAVGAFSNDRLVSARKIRHPILGDGDIISAFDSATYSKGGSALAMIEAFMGKEKFQRAVQKYLRAHAHGNANTQDFLVALADVEGDQRLTKAIGSFLDQPGTPATEVAVSCKAGAKPTVSISQSRYLPVGSAGDANQLWTIPMCLAYEVDGQRARHCFLMDRKQHVETLPTNSCPAWLMPNADGAAYLVYNLDDDGWERLTQNYDKLSVGEKITTAASIHAAFESGTIDSKRLLSLMEMVASDPQWDVARRMTNTFHRLKFLAVQHSDRDKLEERFGGFHGKRFAALPSSLESLRTADADPVKAKQRSDFFWMMALSAKHPQLAKTMAKAGRAYTGFGGDNQMHYEHLHSNLSWLGIVAAARETGLPYFEHLIGHLKEERPRSIRNGILNALGDTTDPALLDRVREYMMADDTPASDTSTLLWRQARRFDNAQSMLDWVTENYDALIEKLPASSHPWLVWRTANNCTTEARDRVEVFFRPRAQSIPGAKRALANVLEEIELCVALRKAQRPSAIQALAN